MIAFAAAAGSSVLAAVAVAGRVAAYPLARSAVRGERLRAWRLACAAGTLVPWAVAAVALLWLVALARTSWWDSPAGALLGATLLGGVVAAFVYDLLRRGSQPYWRLVRDTLADALPAEGPQRARFNADHLLLLSGGEAAKAALGQILDG